MRTSSTRLAELRQRLRSLAEPERAAGAQRFFKTGPGEYGEGDVFLGVRVPETRKLAKAYDGLPLDDIETLLHSPIHEERLLALLLFVQAYSKGNDVQKKDIYRRYLANTAHINGWDLVDTSAPQIVGGQLLDKPRAPLYRLAKSKSLWERRIAVLATFHFVRHNDFTDTFGLAERLLNDREDLIHKAVGWMLREIGKRDKPALKSFLDKHVAEMPRAMLRYTIEHFPEHERRRYLRK